VARERVAAPGRTWEKGFFSTGSMAREQGREWMSV
jgi:hypothetical protein